jgi:preprotein translocase subunit SecG
VIAYVLYTLFVISCFILILVVLLQPGKGDVASALGGGVSGAAFGPRGTTTLLAKITVGAAAAFMIIAFLLSIPGFVVDRSVTSGVAPGEGQPIDVQIPGEGGEAIPAGQIQVNGGQPPAEGQPATGQPAEQPAQPPEGQPQTPAGQQPPAEGAQPPASGQQQ